MSERAAPKQSLKEEAVPVDARKIKSLQTASLNMEGRVERGSTHFAVDVCAGRSSAIDFHPSGREQLAWRDGGVLVRTLNISGGENQDRGTDFDWITVSSGCDCLIWGCQLVKPVCHISSAALIVCVLY